MKLLARPKLISIVLIIILILTGVFIAVKNFKSSQQSQPSPTNASEQTKNISANDKPQIVSTKPDPLDETIISATDTIEITFNRPLENVGEFKNRIEPEIKLKVELSSDRKTAKIKAVDGFLLGTTYTLFIGAESKFDGVGRWGEEKSYHFRTIKYTGV